MSAFDNLKTDEAKAALWFKSNRAVTIACAVVALIAFIAGKLS